MEFEEAAALRDRILELKGEKVSRGIGGLRVKRGKRAAPLKSMRGAAEAAAPYGKKKWRGKNGSN